MTVPDFQTLMRPALAALAERGPMNTGELRDALAEPFGVTAEDRQLMIPSGRAPLYANRVAWAVSHMVQAGLISRPSRGVAAITDRGRQVLVAHPDRVDMRVLGEFPEYQDFRTRRRDHGDPDAQQATETVNVPDSPTESAQDLVDVANAAVAADLLARVYAQQPQFLERLVLRLLAEMEYAPPERLEHLGGTGDGGVDGVAWLDPLRLDSVYIQAKRHDPNGNAIGRPDAQAFVGALLGKGTGRGVFITTARFSRDAREYVEGLSTPKVVLIDGPALARLMLDHNVGVTVQTTLEIKHIDEDYFDEQN